MLFITRRVILAIFFVFVMISTLTPSLWSQSRVQTAAITFDDQRKVEHVIHTYFKAIENNDYATAWNLTSSAAQKEYPKSLAITEHWGLKSVKLISLKRCLGLDSPSGFTFDVPKDTPTICFSVSLDIRPAAHTAWHNGINDRLVDVVRENGEWRINGLNTGP